MTEKNAAGFLELVYSVLWAALILAVYDVSDTALRLMSDGAPNPGRNLMLTVAAVCAGCVLVYFVMMRYAAVFTYETGEKSVRLSRKVGKREKTVEIKNREIRSISKRKPQNPPKTVYNMRKTVFSDKRVYYLIYVKGGREEMAVFEPSEEMAMKISSRVKEG